MALSKITADSIAANAVTANLISNTAIVTALGFTPANKAGDTFTGAVTVSNTLSVGNTIITGVANIAGNLTSTGGASISSHLGFNRDQTNGASLLGSEYRWQISRYSNNNPTYPNSLGIEAYNASGTALGIPLIVDGNVGGNGNAIVRRPTNPAFAAYGSAGGTTYTAGVDTQIIFDQEVYDVHNNYNTSTGTFTAPVDGYYMFYAQHLFYPNSLGDGVYVSFWLSKNGANYTGASGLSRFNNIKQQTTMNVSTLYYLAKNDYVQTKVNASGGTPTYYTASGHAVFYGYLVS